VNFPAVVATYFNCCSTLVSKGCI